ncbi:hypothetical protein F5Y13DRAFT_176317 [Hypoxylon sp. FL1857]|nr:hypothetical protein F5Y13DRAFT_176317 [Hypoxylon sp. FL1857]
MDFSSNDYEVSQLQQRQPSCSSINSSSSPHPNIRGREVDKLTLADESQLPKLARKQDQNRRFGTAVIKNSRRVIKPQSPYIHVELNKRQRLLEVTRQSWDSYLPDSASESIPRPVTAHQQIYPSPFTHSTEFTPFPISPPRIYTPSATSPASTAYINISPPRVTPITTGSKSPSPLINSPLAPSFDYSDRAVERFVPSESLRLFINKWRNSLDSNQLNPEEPPEPPKPPSGSDSNIPDNMSAPAQSDATSKRSGKSQIASREYRSHINIMGIYVIDLGIEPREKVEGWVEELSGWVQTNDPNTFAEDVLATFGKESFGKEWVPTTYKAFIHEEETQFLGEGTLKAKTARHLGFDIPESALPLKFTDDKIFKAATFKHFPLLSGPKPDKAFGYNILHFDDYCKPSYLTRLVNHRDKLVINWEGLVLPYLLVDYKNAGGNMTGATNQLAGGTSVAVRLAHNDVTEKNAVFGIALNDCFAKVYITWSRSVVDPDTQEQRMYFYMRELAHFRLRVQKDFGEFLSCVYNIHHWGRYTRLTVLENSLRQRQTDARAA